MIAVALGVGGGAAFFAWRGHVIKQQRDREERTVQSLLDRHQGREALALLQLLRRETDQESFAPGQELRWKTWELQASLEMRDMPRLLMYYERDPALFVENEVACIMTTRTLLAIHKPEEAAKLRRVWLGREKHKEEWLAYDADECLRRGKADEARALLLTATLSGRADCARLMRLALLSAGRPQEAAGYLNAAYAADPRNSDLRSFRAQILENAGQNELARVEYTAALAVEPGNPLLRDQLAEFYLRQQDYPLALQTLGDNLARGSFDYMWLKAEFWGRVAAPLQSNANKCPSGSLQPLAELMRNLHKNSFWDEAAFARLRSSEDFAGNRQEVHWLRILQYLQDGKEREALELLSGSKFMTRSWNPELESTLRIFLNYRQSGRPPQAGDFNAAAKQHHTLFDAVAAWSNGNAMPDIHSFATGPYAFAGACLASGWIEAALRLAPTDRGMEDAPEWFRYGMVQALRMSRGSGPALELARKQPVTPLLQLATGELLLATGPAKEGLQTLKKISSDSSDAGYRAAWLLALTALREGNTSEAIACVSLQPRLANAITGREIVARATALSGDQAKAFQLYAAMEKESAEAKVFLARRAFAAKQWDEARRLTRALMAQYPDQLSFREDLLKIDRAASRK